MASADLEAVRQWADLVYRDRLENGTLYIMVSIPLRIHIGAERHKYFPILPDWVSPAEYEVGASFGEYREEFHWDLYHHLSLNKGTIYRLNDRTDLHVRRGYHPAYELQIIRDVRFVRMLSRVVGFIKVVTVPPQLNEFMTAYLDFRLEGMARIAKRSCLWAVGAFLRMSDHITALDGVQDHSSCPFAFGDFMNETLRFLYRETPYCMAGVKGRPILVSLFSINLVRLDPMEAEISSAIRYALLACRHAAVEAGMPGLTQEELVQSVIVSINAMRLEDTGSASQT
jgi:hypothetical protein